MQFAAVHAFMLLAVCSGLVLQAAPRRAAAPRCCVAADDNDNVECTGRIVTELKGINGELPDRFMMAVRAIRGEFTPTEAERDTERADDLLTAALTSFPATVRLRVVSKALDDDAAEVLVGDLRQLVESAGGAQADVRVTPRGRRRSVDFELAEVPNLAALGALRGALKDDERVQMVF